MSSLFARSRAVGSILAVLAAVGLCSAAYGLSTAAVTARITASMGGTETATLDLGNASASPAITFTQAFTNGTGSTQANVMWSDTRTLAASAADTLDLAGVLTSAFGQTVTFAKVKGIMITAASGNTNSVLVGGAGTNSFGNWVADDSDVLTIRPGHLFMLGGPGTAGYAVTAGTGDLLRIGNSGGTTPVTYSIILLGTSS